MRKCITIILSVVLILTSAMPCFAKSLSDKEATDNDNNRYAQSLSLASGEDSKVKLLIRNGSGDNTLLWDGHKVGETIYIGDFAAYNSQIPTKLDAVYERDLALGIGQFSGSTKVSFPKGAELSAVTLSVDITHKDSNTSKHLNVKMTPNSNLSGVKLTQNPGYKITEAGEYNVTVKGTFTYKMKYTSKGETIEASQTITRNLNAPFTVEADRKTTGYISGAGTGATNFEYEYKLVPTTKPDVSVVSYAWVYTTAQSATKFEAKGDKLIFSAAEPGEYTFKCTFKDSTGYSATATKKVVLENKNQLNLAADRYDIGPGEAVRLTASVSADRALTNYRYYYNGSETVPGGVSVNAPTIQRTGSFKASECGEYKMYYTLEDAFGNVYRSNEITINVVDLYAKIEAPQTVKQGERFTIYNRSKGQIVKHKFVSKTPDGREETMPSTRMFSSETYLADKEGTWVFTLVVIAVDGRTATDTAVVTVVGDGSTLPPAGEDGVYPAQVPPLPEDSILEPVVDPQSGWRHCLNEPLRGYGSDSDAPLHGNRKATSYGGRTLLGTDMQYYLLDVQYAGYNGNAASLETIFNKQELTSVNRTAVSANTSATLVTNITAGGNGSLSSTSYGIDIVFPKAGTYYVYASGWYYCEQQENAIHTIWGYRGHRSSCPENCTSSHRYKEHECAYTKRTDNIIEVHHEIGKHTVIITPEDVGKVIHFDDNWGQEPVEVEVVLIH